MTIDIQFLEDENIEKIEDEGISEKLRLGDILIKYDLIDDTEVPNILEKQTETGLRFGETILQMGLLTEDQINWALAYHLDIPYVDLKFDMVDVNLARSFPIKMLKQHIIVPVAHFENEITVAMSDPTNHQAIKDIKSVTDRDVKVSIALRQKVLNVLDQVEFLKSDARDVDSISSDEFESHKAKPSQRQDFAEGTSGLAFIHFHLMQALNYEATEIHLEPFQDELRIRYRINRTLRYAKSEPKSIYFAVINRIKGLVGIPVSEAVPRMGYMKNKIGEEELTVQVSFLPGIWGESVVLRILHPVVPQMLEYLNFSSDDLDYIRRQLDSLSGLVVATGPLAESRRQLLYTLVSHVQSRDKRIIMIENPVREKFDFATQIDLMDNPHISAYEILKMIDTQSPDVIVVDRLDGEDGTLLPLLVDCAVNNRLILVGLPYFDPYHALQYLIQNLPFTMPIAANLRFIISQSVFPRLCDETKETYQPSARLLAEADLKDAKDANFYRPASEKGLRSSGYCGEVEIFELLRLSNELKDILFSKVPFFNRTSNQRKFREVIESREKRGVFEQAIERVLEGELFLEDVLARVV
ncbi:MAG: hypothetical protein B6244_12485 [Candidatus Cloacimonetes bacterium 4572_55]|nr:MAG: hypothetical protein B6244_12485 [Candidatus Cloacimonetes bacterium 4572_55]